MELQNVKLSDVHLLCCINLLRNIFIDFIKLFNVNIWGRGLEDKILKTLSFIKSDLEGRLNELEGFSVVNKTFPKCCRELSKSEPAIFFSTYKGPDSK